LSPIDTIKLLGVDLFNSKTYSEAKSALDDWINQLEKIKNKLIK
jgi:oligoendopeptidase F